MRAPDRFQPQLPALGGGGAIDPTDFLTGFDGVEDINGKPVFHHDVKSMARSNGLGIFSRDRFQFLVIAAVRIKQGPEARKKQDQNLA
jgi:hypothetical protein